MTGPYAKFGRDLDELNDFVADWCVDLLRRGHALLSHGYDQAAQRDVEGAPEWRDLSKTSRFPNE